MTAKVEALVIGAGRSGTTTLCDHLARHADIAFSSIKEVNYFSIDALHERGTSYLHGFFQNDERIRVTSDTYLLCSERAPERVAAYNPSMRIIAMLREPVSRALSSYRYAIGAGYHGPSPDFEHWPDYEVRYHSASDPVELDNFAHFYGSMYHLHLKQWLKYFPKEQILLIRTADLMSDHDAVLRNVSLFLGITPFGEVDSIRSNAATGSKSRFLQHFLSNRNHPLRKATRWLVRPFGALIIRSSVVDRLKAINKAPAMDVAPVSPEVEQRLRAYFQKDLDALYDEFGIRP